MPLQHFLQPREAGVKPVVRDAERLSEACRLSIRSAARNTELGSGADSHQVHVVAHCSDTRGAVLTLRADEAVFWPSWLVYSRKRLLLSVHVCLLHVLTVSGWVFSRYEKHV